MIKYDRLLNELLTILKYLPLGWPNVFFEGK